MSDRMELTKLIIAIQRKIDAENLKISLGIASEDSAEQAQAEEKKRQYEVELAYLKKEREALDLPQKNQDPKIQLIPWQATDRNFTHLIIELFDKGYLKVDSISAALAIAAKYFEGVNQDPQVLLTSVSVKSKKEGKDNPISLPAATPRKKKNTMS